MDLLVPVAAGAEGVVKRQLLSLGYPKAPAFDGRIQLSGDWRDVARLNLFLRSGERVLVRLAKFPAVTFDELYDGFYSLPWEDWLRVDSRILMDGKSAGSRLAAVKAAGGVAKKAIIRRLADKLAPGRKTFDESGARTVVDFSVLRDVVTVSVDTSGEGLHKRGYRDLAYTAPLKETLAATLIDLSLWHPDADPEKPFADPFCGSGTLPIEAAMKGLHIPPGLRRRFDFENWAFVPADAMARAREEGEDGILRDRRLHIFASDISPEAVSVARRHAKRAGVGDNISFSVSDVRDFSARGEYGAIVCNPPYGERLEEKSTLPQIYRDFGEAFRRLDSWSAYMITSYEEAERYFGRKAEKNRKIYNGMIRTYFYQFPGPRPPRRKNEDIRRNGS